MFLFSSELKAFHKHPKFIKKINKKAVYQYMDLGYIPSPYCIFEDCKKLNPGHILKLSLETKEIKITNKKVSTYNCINEISILRIYNSFSLKN